MEGPEGQERLVRSDPEEWAVRLDRALDELCRKAIDRLDAKVRALDIAGNELLADLTGRIHSCREGAAEAGGLILAEMPDLPRKPGRFRLAGRVRVAGKPVPSLAARVADTAGNFLAKPEWRTDRSGLFVMDLTMDELPKGPADELPKDPADYHVELVDPGDVVVHTVEEVKGVGPGEAFTLDLDIEPGTGELVDILARHGGLALDDATREEAELEREVVGLVAERDAMGVEVELALNETREARASLGLLGPRMEGVGRGEGGIEETKPEAPPGAAEPLPPVEEAPPAEGLRPEEEAPEPEVPTPPPVAVGRPPVEEAPPAEEPRPEERPMMHRPVVRLAGPPVRRFPPSGREKTTKRAEIERRLAELEERLKAMLRKRGTR